jgi:hypothetical protein
VAVPILGSQINPEAAAMKEATEKAGIEIVGPFYMSKGTDDEYREVFATISQSGANGLFVGGNAELVTMRQLIVELAAKHRLPAIYAYPVFVEAGGLMSYGTDLMEPLRWAARQIDQILNGANPGDIPFYQPTSQFRYCRDDLPKKLKSFLPKLETRIYANTGDVSARSRQTRHKAALDRFGGQRDNRDRGGCLFENVGHPISDYKNNIGIASSGFARDFRVAIDTPFARKPLDHQVFSLNVAELAKFVKELAIILKAAVFGQIGYWMRWVQYREPIHLLRLHCPCGP